MDLGAVEAALGQGGQEARQTDGHERQLPRPEHDFDRAQNEFDATVTTLHSMFSDLERDTVAMVLESVGGNADDAVNALLAMNDTSPSPPSISLVNSAASEEATAPRIAVRTHQPQETPAVRHANTDSNLPRGCTPMPATQLLAPLPANFLLPERYAVRPHASAASYAAMQEANDAYLAMMLTEQMLRESHMISAPPGVRGQWRGDDGMEPLFDTAAIKKSLTDMGQSAASAATVAKQKIMSIKEKVGSKLDSTAQQRSSRMGPMRTDFGSRANYDIRLLDDDDDDT